MMMMMSLVSSARDGRGQQSAPAAAASVAAAAAVCVLFMVAAAAGKAQACRHAQLIRTGVTADERGQILDTHNRLRSQVAQGTVPNQPGAQNMQEMVWDDELAYKAQQWAQQCTFDHDPGRYLNRFTMGQNLAIIWSTIPLADDDGDFPSRIQNWFNEVQKYAWGAQWSEATGHYSQLVWGDTNLIGCGFSYYKDARRFNKLWVCNYGPGGNVVGSNPYEVGHPSCSNYGMQPSYRYSGLCSNNNGGPTGPSDNSINSNNNNGLQNNYLGHNGFTYKTETYNAPTPYQPPSAPASLPPPPPPPPQPQPQPAQPLQNVFKPIVQAVVQPVNNFINTDYSFKSIFDRFKDVLNLQRPEQSNHNNNNNNNGQYNSGQYNSGQYNNGNYQHEPSQYQEQSPYQQQAYQPAYSTAPDQQSYQTYQQPQQQPQQQQQQPSYQSYQPQAPVTTYYHSPPPAPVNNNNNNNNRNNPFLTYDWSQLFNQNNDKNNG